MLFKSENMTQASGSIAGVTYSHNKAGLYRRARSIPTNPNTGNQLQVRSAFTTLVNRWTNVLTNAQRAAWSLYAANVPVVNRLGDPIFLSGQNWYIGANTPRIQANTKLAAGLALADDAPTIFDRGTFTTPSQIYAFAGSAEFTYTNTDAWASEAGSALLIYMGKPQNPTINFFKGPWRLLAVVEGAETPPTPPLSIAQNVVEARAFPYALDQHVWTMYAVTRADGRYVTHRMVGPSTVTV